MPQLLECLACKVSIQNKRGSFITLYPSLRQSHYYFLFLILLKEFEKLLSSINKKRTDFTTIVGDFNARSPLGGLEIQLQLRVLILKHYFPIMDLSKLLMNQPNGHTTSNWRGFDVDVTSIRRRPNFDEFPRRFHVLFRCNFDGRNIHVDSTYFFDVILMVKKYKLFSRTCFDVISMVEKSTSIAHTFLT